ncbi:hypothetical protein CBG25_05050 [Arsenophonus sp. ENCA]|uniref:hypothetical protein n=1 Tax=Arsenophonus sp. ENCA TaxID=1987579 RepID=UPI000BD323A4|nr:hypothetical protein [Arsenophonus sp. ENCA]PAV07258.1 hypothetical protein CBG25_05050 [Arsenophonus sp. ENCA]
MTLEVEFWTLFGLLISFMGFVFTLARLFLGQMEKRQVERFRRLEASLQHLSTLEREFLTFKADLPVQYVRREDYVRGQTVIEAKLDALYQKLETVQYRQTMTGIHHE